ncbi:MAG: prephytoene pyrophosphate synthase CrtB [Pseudomonadota bacterium]|jgi:phytoene synthase
MRRSEIVACRALMRDGSKSFFLASLALPKRVRAPATALYAFCRVADDAIDRADDPERALSLLRERLDAIYAGAPGPDLADRAMAAVVDEIGLPRTLPEALLEGFAWDTQGRSYETIESLHDYGARVAGAVGAMMALVMETREPCALARACELGVAMQLTNIARDVGEDARMGRLYLPAQWMREAGLDPCAWLAAPFFDHRIAGVIARLLDEAERLYARAECGVSALPRDCRPAIQAARLVYAEIGRELARRGHDSVRHRAVVGLPRKLARLLQASASILIAPGRPVSAGSSSAALPAVGFLVDAAASAELPARTYYQRTLRMLELFERNAQRRRTFGRA